MAYKRIETNFCISRLLLIYSYKFTNVLTITITIITITKFSNLIGYQLMMGNLTNGSKQEDAISRWTIARDITLFRCRQAVVASLKEGSSFLFGFVIESIWRKVFHFSSIRIRRLPATRYYCYSEHSHAYSFRFLFWSNVSTSSCLIVNAKKISKEFRYRGK